MSAARHLRAVPDEPAAPPAASAPRHDIYAYEHEQRRRLAERDWAGVHVRGDRGQALDLPDRPKRGWWK